MASLHTINPPQRDVTALQAKSHLVLALFQAHNPGGLAAALPRSGPTLSSTPDCESLSGRTSFQDRLTAKRWTRRMSRGSSTETGNTAERQLCTRIFQGGVVTTLAYKGRCLERRFWFRSSLSPPC